MENDKKLNNFIKTTIRKFLNESITKKEFDEMKEYLKNGGILQNDVVGYQILIRKDGELVFYINGSYKFFKNEDAFVRAAIRTVKIGY